MGQVAVFGKTVTIPHNPRSIWITSRLGNSSHKRGRVYRPSAATAGGSTLHELAARSGENRPLPNPVDEANRYSRGILVQQQVNEPVNPMIIKEILMAEEGGFAGPQPPDSM